MSKRKAVPTWEPEIDQAYERRVQDLSAVDGHVSDFAGQYAIEPVRPQPPATARQSSPNAWTPAQSPQQAAQSQRGATVTYLRQMIGEQGQEPARTDTGNKFVITDDSDARTRASAGIAWWLVSAVSLVPLGLGLGLWKFWGWGFLAFTFTFLGAGMLVGLVLLNWQSFKLSPIAVERRQRRLDHEYRMYKEANAQRTRELIVGAFLGDAGQDVARNRPVTVEGQLLLVDGQNKAQP